MYLNAYCRAIYSGAELVKNVLQLLDGKLQQGHHDIPLDGSDESNWLDLKCLFKSKLASYDGIYCVVDKICA